MPVYLLNGKNKYFKEILSMTHIDMRFGVIRTKHKSTNELYILDGKYYPNCRLPTEVIEADISHIYCTNKMCNAFIKGDN